MECLTPRSANLVTFYVVQDDLGARSAADCPSHRGLHTGDFLVSLDLLWRTIPSIQI